MKYYGTWGWAEFDSNRKDILDEYELAKIRNSSKPVKTEQGIVFEKKIINWLTTYLPSRFGVTGGYIAPNNLGTNNKIYHFDLIIYLKNESPVLWVDVEGDIIKSRAIPAEFVLAVFEIKSTFNHSNIKKAIDKLHQIDLYKEDLHRNYFSGIIFAELLEKDITKTKMLYDLFKTKDIFNFWNGLIMKNSIEDDISGLFTFMKSTTNQEILPNVLVEEIGSYEIVLNTDRNLTIKGSHAGATLTKISSTKWAVTKECSISYGYDGYSLMLSWSRDKFLNFALELINKLNGKDPDYINKPRYARVFDVIEDTNA